MIAQIAKDNLFKSGDIVQRVRKSVMFSADSSFLPEVEQKSQFSKNILKRQMRNSDVSAIKYGLEAINVIQRNKGVSNKLGLSRKYLLE